MSNNVLGAANQQGSQAVIPWEFRSPSATSKFPSRGSRAKQFACFPPLDPSETTRRIPQIDRAMAILLGILFTDGCVSPKRGRHGEYSSWRIYFANTSPKLVAVFRECMMEAFALEKPRVRLGKTNDGLLKAVVDSKAIGTYLVNSFGTFRTLRFSDGTLPKTKLPVRQLLESGFARNFLSAAFSCDGGVSFYPAQRSGKRGGTRWLIRTVFLACAHPELRANYQQLLQAFGISARDVVKDKRLKIERERDIQAFHGLIGFLQGVEATRHSKFWHGTDKQKVLELMIHSYSNPSYVLNHAHFLFRGNDIVRTP